jgi:hypothetical protein
MLGSQPVAWAVMYPNGKSVDTVFEYEPDAREAACGDEEVVALYRKPALTDEERKVLLAIEADAAYRAMLRTGRVVRGLLDRLG